MSHFFFEDFFSHPEWGEVRWVAQAIQPGSGGGGVPSGPAGGDLSGIYPNPLFGAGIDRVDGINQVLTLTITGTPTGGSFTITFSGFTSAAIPFNATAAQVETALLAVPTIGSLGVDCTGGPLPGTPVLIERTGPWAAQTTASALTTTDSFTGGTAPASSIAITTAAFPLVPNPSATQIGAAGVYLADGDAIKFGNFAGTSWSPVLSRDSNVVTLRGGGSVPVLIADSSGRVGFGMGVIPSTYSLFDGAVVIRNAQSDLGGNTAVTQVTIVAGARQIITAEDLLKFLDAAGAVLGARINENAYFINGKIAAPADAELSPSEGTWYLTSGLPVWKGKTGGGVVVSFDAGDHSARHENGGADEINVLGLSGLLADGQTPLAHQASHNEAGTDELKLDDLGIPDDNTDLNASSTRHGLLPKLSNISTEFLNGQGGFTVPGAGGGAPTNAPYVTTAADAGLSAEVVLGTGVIMSGTLAARPAASIAGRLYFATDVNAGTLYRDTGAAWVQIATGLNGRMPPSLVCWTGHPGPALTGGSGALATANRAQGHRVIVPRTGTLVDVQIYIANSSGNIEVGILDTTATTRNRLWTTGSIASPGTTWQAMGNPNLAVTEGDQLDFYVNADNTTVTFNRILSGGIAAATILPTSFFPAAGGGKPAIIWQGPAATFPLAATLAEASMTTTVLAPCVIARIS